MTSRARPAYETGLAGHHTWRGDQVTLDPEIHDERLLLANVAGRGTTVLTACSHAGVVNVGLEARRLQASQPIDLLLGGYHLAGTTVEDRIEPTVRDLIELVEPEDRRARTLHRMASRRRTRRRVQPDPLRAQRGRHALRAHRGIGRTPRHLNGDAVQVHGRARWAVIRVSGQCQPSGATSPHDTYRTPDTVPVPRHLRVVPHRAPHRRRPAGPRRRASTSTHPPPGPAVGLQGRPEP